MNVWRALADVGGPWMGDWFAATDPLRRQHLQSLTPVQGGTPLFERPHRAGW